MRTQVIKDERGAISWRDWTRDSLSQIGFQFKGSPWQSLRPDSALLEEWGSFEPFFVLVEEIRIRVNGVAEKHQ